MMVRPSAARAVHDLEHLVPTYGSSMRIGPSKSSARAGKALLQPARTLTRPGIRLCGLSKLFPSTTASSRPSAFLRITAVIECAVWSPPGLPDAGSRSQADA